MTQSARGVSAPVAEGPGLEVSDLTVAYGGSVAVSHVEFDAPLAQVTGLIGPNGAGKTSTFNACNGLVRPRTGTIRFLGEDVTRGGTAARARRGLGRTFQRVEVCNAMTVRENVALGPEARMVGGNPFHQFLSGRAQRLAIADATSDAMTLCGIDGCADRLASTLTTGQRRLLELARIVAGGFSLLLLDEPSSGLDESETKRFGEMLLRIVTERAVGILLVEHDMSLVMDVCDYLHVLDFGTLIFGGTPVETRSSPAVRAAYLGDEVGLEVLG